MDEVSLKPRAPEAFRLTELAAASGFNGASYSTLDTEAKAKLDDSTLRAYIVRQVNPPGRGSITQIFERLNTGGTLLQSQEVRNCVYHGPLNSMLKQVNLNPAWREVFGTLQPERHLRDTELVLRFLALHFELDRYEKPMKEFLNGFMDRHRYASSEEIEKYRAIFITTSQRVLDALSPKPFHLIRGLNVAAFDAVFVAFASNQGGGPEDLAKRYRRLRRDKNFKMYVHDSTTDTSIVRDRIGLASQILFDN